MKPQNYLHCSLTVQRLKEFGDYSTNLASKVVNNDRKYLYSNEQTVIINADKMLLHEYLALHIVMNEKQPS